MKLLKALMVIPFASIGVIPLITNTSCSKKSLFDKLEQDAIKEFSEICKFPHPSDKFLHLVPFESNCLKLSDYLKSRIEKLTGAKVWQDKYANLWFDLPANDKSLEDAPAIAIQCHMDMVFTFDPSKYESGKYPDPSQTQIEIVEETIGGKRFIHSKDYKTSVGGDNGIGISTILALISNNEIKHGKLRIIFTNCEENAMQGALLLVEGHKNDSGEVDAPATTPELLHGIKYVLNMDAGIGNDVPVACSGAIGSWYYQYFEKDTTTFTNKYELKISKFNGGHSGFAVRENFGNAIKAACEVLFEIAKDNEIQIASITSPGTTVYNIIATDCVIQFACAADISSQIQNAINNVKAKHNNQSSKSNYWKDVDKALFEVNACTFNKALSVADSKRIINLNDKLVYGMDIELEEKGYKTSSNVGPLTLSYDDDKFFFRTASYSRSDDDNKVKKYKESNMKAASDNNIEYLCDAQFHPWVEDTNKKLYKLNEKALNSVGFNNVTPLKAHGGLETAAWSWAIKNIEKIEDGNCSATGVNILDEHKPTESIEVESIQKCMKVIQYILLNAKELI